MFAGDGGATHTVLWLSLADGGELLRREGTLFCRQRRVIHIPRRPIDHEVRPHGVLLLAHIKDGTRDVLHIPIRAPITRSQRQRWPKPLPSQLRLREHFGVLRLRELDFFIIRPREHHDRRKIDVNWRGY